MINSRDMTRFFIAFLMIIMLLMIYKESHLQSVNTLNASEIPENSVTLEGYVVSKRMNSIWIANEPVSMAGRVTGYFSDYGAGSIIVREHNDVEDRDLFKPLKTNQKIRVYGDYLLESNPGRISAYAVEVVEED